jgi:RNA polymerase sigma factor (sigma-70 family)
MASSVGGAVKRQMVRLYGEGTVAGMTEAQLVERFADRRDEAAFEALVAHHGPMVLSVCRGALRDPNDADDAFQATFLVLARKASTIRGGEALGAWLHRVARRVSARAGADTTRRRSREQFTLVEPAADGEDFDRTEVRRIVHEEVDRLPRQYREAVVLCDLEGRTHEEAARQLNWPVGTVKGRLFRARCRLRDRLARRGLAGSAVIAAGLTVNAQATLVTDALRETTVRAAIGFAAGRAAASARWAPAARLAEGVLTTMLRNQLKSMGAGVIAVLTLTFGLGTLAQGRQGPSDAGKPAVAQRPGAAHNDRDLLQGRWTLVSVHQDGMAKDERARGQMVVTGDEVVSREPGNEIYYFIKLNTETSPAEIDARGHGRDGDQVVKAAFVKTPEAIELARLIKDANQKLEKVKTFADPARWNREPAILSAQTKLDRLNDQWQNLWESKELAIRNELHGVAANEAFGAPARSAPAPYLIEGEIVRGIYELRGDRLTISYARANEPRPTSFEPGTGGSNLVQIWRKGMSAAPRIPDGSLAEVVQGDATLEPKDLALRGAVDTQASKPTPGSQADGAKNDALSEQIIDVLADIEFRELEIQTLKTVIASEMTSLLTVPGVYESELQGGPEAKRKRAAVNRDLREQHLAVMKKDYISKARELKQLQNRLSVLTRQSVPLSAEAPASIEQPSPKAEPSKPTSGSDRKLDSPNGDGPSTASRTWKAKIGDRLIVEVLEALPGRPITGERRVREDGTISLGFYGDVKVEGLTRREIKVKVVEHLKKFLDEDTLGLTFYDDVEAGDAPKTVRVAPADSDRVFVEDVDDSDKNDKTRIARLEQKVNDLLRVIQADISWRRVSGIPDQEMKDLIRTIEAFRKHETESVPK